MSTHPDQSLQNNRQLDSSGFILAYMSYGIYIYVPAAKEADFHMLERHIQGSMPRGVLLLSTAIAGIALDGVDNVVFG